MTDYENLISSTVVELAQRDFARMVHLARLLDGLSRRSAYRELVYPELPEAARFDPGHDSVMMCYDFHLSEEGPKLIEVNTNAGGGLFAYRAANPGADRLGPGLKAKLLGSFSAEFYRYSGGARLKPARVAIIDEHPEEQFLYPEMEAFASLFSEWGVPTVIVDPTDLKVTSRGLSHDGQLVDLIYNRHTDFYLETKPLEEIRAAYLARHVCLTPNPHMYGLLGDKRRLTLWADPVKREKLPLSEREDHLLSVTIPASRLLRDMDGEQVWSQRKRLVFKPVDRFGSRGVLLGEKVSRSRFGQLNPDVTLVQQLIPPSRVETDDGTQLKTDLRLYTYRDQILGVTARLYRGQVTNLRTPGGGFAAVRVVAPAQS